MNYDAGVIPVPINNYNPEFVALKRIPILPGASPIIPSVNKGTINNYSIDTSYSNRPDFILNRETYDLNDILKTNRTIDNFTKDTYTNSTIKELDHLINYL